MIRGVLGALFVFLFNLHGISQFCDTVPKYTNGLVAFTFFNEDVNTYSIRGEVLRDFKHNFFVQISSRKKNDKTQISSIQLRNLVSQFADLVPSKVVFKSKFRSSDSLGNNIKVKLSLSRELSSQTSNLVFIKRNNVWCTYVHRNVLYFRKNHQGLFFEKSMDSICIGDKITPAYSHYYVIKEQDSSGVVLKEELFSYEGVNCTGFFKINTLRKPQRHVLMINGYRGHHKENDHTDHLITSWDKYHYWYKIDDKFQEYLKHKVYFLDASMSLKTTNHRNALNFIWSYYRTSYPFFKEYAKNKKRRFNLTPNISGFYNRKSQGKISGKVVRLNFLSNIQSVGVKDTIDLICHSMGYAYMLGLLDELKSDIILGKCFILAPENSSVEGFKWSDFEEVWQIGANLDQPTFDPIWLQDGIAPQVQVKDLEQIEGIKGGRIFFPENYKCKNFVDSHMMYNYDWIFNSIEEHRKRLKL
jgi:hypothetical protein